LAETPRQRLFRGEAEGHHRATGNVITVPEREYSQWRIGSIGIDQACPAPSRRYFWQGEFHDFVMRIVDQEQGCVGSLSLYPGLLRPTVQEHAKATRVRALPLSSTHFRPIRRQPGDILHVQLRICVTDNETATVQDRKGSTSGNQLACELAQ